MSKKINCTLTDKQWEMIFAAIIRGEVDIEMNACDEWSEYKEKDLNVLRRAIAKIVGA